jgi:hypothetical protein
VQTLTGVIETTVDELVDSSNIPITELKPALRKLVRHGFITMKQRKNNLTVKLKHYGLVRAKRHHQKIQKAKVCTP